MKIRSRLLYAAYLLTVIVAVCVLAQFADGLLGRFMPVSPWPPLRMAYLDFTEASVKTIEFNYTARINSLGLRAGEIPPKREDVFRIVVFGDSYVFGWGVDSDDTWIARLNSMFAEAGGTVEVINAGRCATAPIEYAQRAELLLPKLQPGLTLICVLQGGDINETADAWWYLPNCRLLLKDWRDRDAPSLAPGTAIKTAEDETNWYIEEAKLFSARMTPEQRARFDTLDATVKRHFFDGVIFPSVLECAIQYPDRYSLLPQMPFVQVWKKTAVMAAMFERIRRIAAMNHSRTLALVMPEGAFANRPAMKNWTQLGFDISPEMFGDKTCADMIANAAQKSGIGVLDLTLAFEAHGDEDGLFFSLDNHMTASGNLLLAKSLFPLLAKEIPK